MLGLETSYKYQPERGTRTYGCISKGDGSTQLSLCSVRARVMTASDSRTRAPASLTAPSFGSQDGTVAHAPR